MEKDGQTEKKLSPINYDYDVDNICKCHKMPRRIITQ